MASRLQRQSTSSTTFPAGALSLQPTRAISDSGSSRLPTLLQGAGSFLFLAQPSQGWPLTVATQSCHHSHHVEKPVRRCVDIPAMTRKTNPPAGVASVEVVEKKPAIIITEKDHLWLESAGPEMSASPVRNGRRKRAINGLLVYSCVVFAAASFLYGYDNAVVGPVAAMAPFVKKYQGPNLDIRDGNVYVFTAINQSLIFSLPLVGSVVGAMCASPLTARFGRKWPLVCAYTASLGGVLLQLLAPNLAAFIIGRFWNNITTGLSMVVAPLYLSEIVPPAMRGAAVSSLNICNLVSAVIAASVAYASSGLSTNAAFQIPLGVQCVAPALLIPLMLPLPESPQWLTQRSRLAEARTSLQRVRAASSSAEALDEELRVMLMVEDAHSRLTANVGVLDLFRSPNRERTLVAGSMYSFNQLSGIILTTTYATIFLQQLGIGNPFSITVAAQACTLAGTLLAPLILDRSSGRRPVMLSGMLLLLCIDVAAGTLAFSARAGNTRTGLAIVVLSCIFNVVWAASFYSVSALLPTELAPARLRGLTMSYTIAWAQATAVCTTLAVPQITAGGRGGGLGARAYLVFAGCMVFVLAWVWWLVPETQGRTLAEIDELYARKGLKRRRWKGVSTSVQARRGSVLLDGEEHGFAATSNRGRSCGIT